MLLILLLVVAVGLLLQRVPAWQDIARRRVAYAATATYIAQSTLTPTFTPLVLPTLNPGPSGTPVLLPTVEDLHILPTPTAGATLPPDAPPRATLFPQQYQYDLDNFLVLGSDRRGDGEAYRTDVIVVVSVNRSTLTVNLLSIPRDLYVYIPGWGMDRINTAELHQTQTRHAAHRLGLLAETIEYNLGIRIDHLARVDFDGFQNLIDLLGGITIPVDCPVTGYQPVPDPAAENGVRWEPFTLEPGLHDMNGAQALWYVRQRIDSSDFDRNRRQQIVLRALWRKARESDLLGNLPQLWEHVSQMVDTDLNLQEALGLLPVFASLDANRLESHFLGLDEVNLWRTPTGASVLVIDPVPFAVTMTHFFTPPTENQLIQEWARVNILNASSWEDADQLAAARLQWMGLLAIPQGRTGVPSVGTTVYDHTAQVKGSSLNTIQAALGVSDEDIITAPNASYEVDFTVVIGDDFAPCVVSPWLPLAQSD